MRVTYHRPPRGQGGLYLIKLSDRHYYGGSTGNFRGRWYEHLRSLRNGSHKNPHMQAVFNKHQCFEPTVLQVVKGCDVRIAAEQSWLDKHFGEPGCVNLLARAEAPPMAGRTHTEESRRKMAARKRGVPLTREHRESLSAAQKRRHERDGVSAETRRKLSQAGRGRSRPDTAAMNRARAGWRHSEEALKKISEARRVGGFKGKNHSEETRRRISESLKGRTPSKETLRKRSESLKRAWAACKARSSR